MTPVLEEHLWDIVVVCSLAFIITGLVLAWKRDRVHVGPLDPRDDTLLTNASAFQKVDCQGDYHLAVHKRARWNFILALSGLGYCPTSLGTGCDTGSQFDGLPGRSAAWAAKRQNAIANMHVDRHDQFFLHSGDGESSYAHSVSLTAAPAPVFQESRWRQTN